MKDTEGRMPIAETAPISEAAPIAESAPIAEIAPIADEDGAPAGEIPLEAGRRIAMSWQEADAFIPTLAARQHGLVGRWQLLAAGVPRHVIDNRLRQRRLHPVWRGIYRVGPVAAPLEREMAAVLTCGTTAVLSHRSAAALHGLLAAAGANRPVELTVARNVHVNGEHLVVHRSTRLGPGDVTEVRGLPVTTVTRTLLDLAGLLDARLLEQAWAAADRAGVLDGDQISRALARQQRRPGTPLLRALLDVAHAAFVRSEAEAALLALLRQAGLPAPEVNVRIEGLEVDLAWRRQRFVVEVDGLAFHASRTAAARDRQRDAVLFAAGWRVLRVTWQQIRDEPFVLVARIAQALARAS